MRAQTALPPMQNTKTNCLNSVRLVAALSVLMSHSWPITGLPLDPLSRWVGISQGSLAVYVFFAISGYLVTQSATTNRSTLEFISARFFRIFPGLLVCVLTTVIAASAISTLPLGDFFTAEETRSYIRQNIVLKTQYTLPGVFAVNPLAHTINGSLWTLKLEVWLYLAMTVVMVSSITLHRATFNALCIVFAFLCLKTPTDPTFLPPTWPPEYTYNSWCFMTGALLYMNRDKLPLTLRGVFLLWVLVLLGRKSSVHSYLLCSAVGYSGLWVGFLFRRDFTPFAHQNDISYGAYLYAWPVQQVFAMHPAFHGHPWLLILASIPITLGLGYASWRLVEKPALRLKKILARRATAPASSDKPITPP